MDEPPTILERAFELARSGTCRDLTELRRQLKNEGYTHIREHFYSRSLVRQLQGLMKVAREG